MRGLQGSWTHFYLEEVLRRSVDLLEALVTSIRKGLHLSISSWKEVLLSRKLSAPGYRQSEE